MADQFKNVGEVGHAMRGIRDQLSLHAKGFGIAVLVFAGAFGGLYYQTISISRDVNDLRVTAARIESKIDAIRGDTQQTRSDVDEVRTVVSAMPAERLRRDVPYPSEAEADLLAAFGEAMGIEVTVVPLSEILLTSYGSLQFMMQMVDEGDLRKLQAACTEAGNSPEIYSTTLLGACAAVVRTARDR